MRTKNYKTMIAISIFALLLCIVGIVWIVAQSYYINMTSDTGSIWHEDLYPIQLVIFFGRLIFKSLFYLLIMVFLFKQQRAIKNGVLFPRANVKVLYGMAFSYLIGNHCSDNIQSVLFIENHASFVINADTLLYTALLIVFALMYKVAVNVSEENNLTI